MIAKNPAPSLFMAHAHGAGGMTVVTELWEAASFNVF